MSITRTNTDETPTVEQPESSLPQFSLEAYLPQIINMTAASLNERLARELKTIDLPLAHWRILAILAWKRCPCTLSDIRQWTVIDISTLSRAVLRLEQEGLVVRAWKEDDARYRAIELSDKGRALFGKAWRIVQPFQAHATKGIEARDLETAMRVLNQIRIRMEQSPFSLLG